MRCFPIVLVPLAWLAACCSDSTSTFNYHRVQTEGVSTTIREADVEIKIVAVPYGSTTAVRDGQVTENSRSLLGHPFGISDGEFHIGPVNYGPAPAGARIVVARTGVTIDGERRGDVPPALTETTGGEELVPTQEE